VPKSWLFQPTSTRFSVVSAFDDNATYVNQGRKVNQQILFATVVDEDIEMERTKFDSTFPIYASYSVGYVW